MPRKVSVDSPFKWYVILSILTVICIVNLILAVYFAIGLCSSFANNCETNTWFWINIAISLVVLLILVLLLYLVLKQRNVWESRRRKQKNRIQMRLKQRTTADSLRIGATNSMDRSYLDSNRNSTNCWITKLSFIECIQPFITFHSIYLFTNSHIFIIRVTLKSL